MTAQTRSRKSTSRKTHDDAPLGVVGQGVMGAIISTCFLAAGRDVRAVSFEAPERQSANKRIIKHLRSLHREGVIKTAPAELMKRYQVAEEYSILAPCALVVESIIEDLDVKRAVHQNIEVVVGRKTLIGSNTSALPITDIQRGAQNPERILGMHWLSSSPFGRCIEVMGGEQTSRASTRRAYEMVKSWGKSPTLVKEDRRGFLGNRIFYAMLREAFALVDEGVGTPEEIDTALQESVGLWLPFAGPFAYLDLCGPHFYPDIMSQLYPDLSCTHEVPKSLRKIVDSGGQGIFNGRGFYHYGGEEATQKRADFDEFRRELSTLMTTYEKKREHSHASWPRAKRNRRVGKDR